MTKRIAIFVLCHCLAAIANAAEVRLRSSVVCPAPVVRLSDVAEVQGSDAAQTQALGMVPICAAPEPGNQKSLTQHQVRQLLVLSGIDPGQVTVTGSDAVEVLAAAGGVAARPTSPNAAAVRHALFSAEEFAKPALPAAPPQPATFTPRTLAAPADSIAKVKLVQRGAVVAVSVRRPGVRVTTQGKALDAGSVGDTISVELADSRERVLAQIIGPQAVEIRP